MITIATAECFTHGKIGLELHKLSQNYDGDFAPEFMENTNIFKDTIVICSLFIPTITAVETVLNIPKPPKPKQLIKDIKVYDEEGDMEMSFLMAKAVKQITKSDIGIGTTAGVGKGAITILTDKFKISTNSGFYTNFLEANGCQLYQRQIHGIKKSLKMINLILKEDFNSLNDLEDVKIEKI